MSDNSGGSGFWITVLLGVAVFGWIKIHNLEKENGRLKQRIAEVQSKADALQASSDELQEQVKRFENEDWRDVVPDARKASEQVQTDADNLKSATDESGEASGDDD